MGPLEATATMRLPSAETATDFHPWFGTGDAVQVEPKFVEV